MKRPVRTALATTLAATLAALVAGCATTPPPATEASVQAHIAAAEAAAGKDYPEYLGLCKPAPVKRPEAGSIDLAALIARPAPPPGAAFDNLAYVGSAWVSAWALKTSDGVILIDALNTVDEVDRLIVPGLKSQGLSPSDVKTVLVTHGHGDHYGGADHVKALAGATKPRVVMSALDWTMTATQLEFASPIWPAPPKIDRARDVSAQDGDLLRQGDTTVKLVVTPGHTLGTLSPVFDVRSGGRSYKALVWGGTSFNFGRDMQRLDAYIAAADRMRELARTENIEVLLSNHPANDLTVKRLAAMKANPAMANPFVIGNAGVLRTLTVISECAKANRDRFAMMP
ncbi:MBL fold metallo-hydrolase [Ideonella sp. DXS22W]|uniref:beta-lactamase n=1 Tax=Pseudaquabacterium inlustre TaxID=2984192 RepID=A0ABU9CMD2_9BURK